MSDSIKTTSAKHISSRITKRRLEHVLGWDRNRYVSRISWIILIMVSVLFATIISSWVEGIKPPSQQPGIEVSVTKIEQNKYEVMITYIEKDVRINYLTYYTPYGSGFIYKSTNSSDPVRDAGEPGTIPAFSGHLEISAILADGKTIKVYDGEES